MDTEEIFLPVVIPGYCENYKVSNKGTVKSFMKNLDNRIITDYYSVNLSRNNISTTRRVHGLVAEAFIENPRSVKQIKQLCFKS